MQDLTGTVEVAQGGTVSARVLGYASAVEATTPRTGDELRRQSWVLTSECRRRGLNLTGMIRERTPHNARAMTRPGLGYAMEQIARGDAAGLVVTDLSRLSPSAADLGVVLQWFASTAARLIAVSESVDTATPEGRLAVRALIAVGKAERDRLAARTRNGLRAARESSPLQGRPAVADDRELHARIVAMRDEGMTMQAIVDRLNADGVPTVRGGQRWRPSSVQRALGYRRRRTPPWREYGNGADAQSADEELDLR